ncbi:MAG: protein-L-isoaspartate(D-aspartate) O-methyltransferase [Bacteroidota bacterium]
MKDTYKHKGLRQKLVEEIKKKGITDVNVLNAIDKIPRHLFLDSSFLDFAYQDKPFPIGSGQTISQPYTVAYQTQLMEVKKGDKVLEIGTGSGYQACVLIEMGARVYTVERIRSLYSKTKPLLEQMKYMPKMFYGDGYKGLPAFAPFDKILVTAAAPYVPDALLKQLKVGGLLIIPVGPDDTQKMQKIKKISETEYDTQSFGNFRFVPLLNDRIG